MQIYNFNDNQRRNWRKGSLMAIWFQNKISQGILVLFLVVGVIAGFEYWLLGNKDKKIELLQTNLIKLESKCTFTPEEYKQAKNEYKQARQTNDKESQAKITYITKFKKDDNETKCQAANRLIRTTSHSF
ncbi:hypothetical protein BN3087_220037 [Sulfurovum sp. enrichment culture clone C5]|uniref:Uncharacterized protein n=1 Tax=Sulfurovum sp. enrichment culture clone C5 TaxID=497650 RepID=A0A0S4XLN5_9BACT|nr:hypothetical protein BN3087_220037 [Sulfurovum sp. enrichment culture clone C5]